jgi:L-ascorbate metabolism protein UlaG (beta-lactamase superfamily)
MKITKFGHCCLLIETGGARIITDPGSFSVTQNQEKNIAIVLITHEHGDHFHVESVKEIIKNNPAVVIVTNSAVGKLLSEKNIAHTVLEKKDSKKISGVLIEAFDGKHEEIFEDFGQVQNTGYLIDGKLFYPGDSFCEPQKAVDTLALPVAGPWCKISDAIRYALRVNPKKVFPVHDAVVKDEALAFFHKIPEIALGKKGIKFVSLSAGHVEEF